MVGLFDWTNFKPGIKPVHIIAQTIGKGSMEKWH